MSSEMTRHRHRHFLFHFELRQVNTCAPNVKFFFTIYLFKKIVLNMSSNKKIVAVQENNEENQKKVSKI